MNFSEYQDEANKTAIYPELYEIIYPALGLASEAGEVASKVKKVLRDKNGIFSTEDIVQISQEAADCLWYIAALCSDLGLGMDYIARCNLEKLKDRQERGVLGGSGDNR